MGFFKKAIAKHKQKKADRKEKRKHRKNAGDRHHSRKNARKDRRAQKRRDKHAMKLEKMALRGSNNKSTWGSIFNKVGAVANQYIGVKDNETGALVDGFIDEDGTMEVAATGERRELRPEDTVYLGKNGAEEYREAGGKPTPHNDFLDVDGDGYDDKTGLDQYGKSKAANEEGYSASSGGKELNVSINTAPNTAPTPSRTLAPYKWGKYDQEGVWDYIKRLYTDKPLVMWTSTVCIVGLLAWGIVEGIKAWKKRKKKGSSKY